MKKILMVLFVGLLTVALAGCGGIESEIKGTYASDHQVIVVDKDKYTLYAKGNPDKPSYVLYYKVINTDEGINKMVVDISSEKDGEPFTRETWYKNQNEFTAFLEDGGEFVAYPEEGLEDYKSAEPEDTE